MTSRIRLTLLSIILTVSALWVQAVPPQGIHFQAVARFANGNLLTNQAVQLNVDVFKTNEPGMTVYAETHSVTTDEHGTILLVIGEGDPVGTFRFDALDWSVAPYSVRLSMDPSGGTQYDLLGESRLLSVPYALHAGLSTRSLQSIQEQDPLFSTSLAYNISPSDTARWSIPGKKGDRGDDGPPGLQGASGQKGDKGDRGDDGAPGQKGDKGDQGPQGNSSGNSPSEPLVSSVGTTNVTLAEAATYTDVPGLTISVQASGPTVMMIAYNISGTVSG